LPYLETLETLLAKRRRDRHGANPETPSAASKTLMYSSLFIRLTLEI